MRAPIAILLLTCSALTAQAADIYCAPNKRDCYDRPRPGAELVSSGTPQRSESAADATTGASSPAATANRTSADPVQNQRALDTARAAMEKDLASKRSELCKLSQDRYQATINSRRIYKTNQAGEREYLSDADADALRLSARVAMEEACR